jgi:hypothetical protein
MVRFTIVDSQTDPLQLPTPQTTAIEENLSFAETDSGE